MRALSAALAAAYLVSAVPAFAESSSSNTSSAASSVTSSSASSVRSSASSALSLAAVKDPCAGVTGKARGKCMSDTLNTLARELKAFAQEQREERDAWRAEHDSMGVTAEYRQLRQEFLMGQLTELKLFQARQTAIRKAMNDGQKAFIRTASAASKGYTRAVTGEDAEAAKAKCSKLKDDRAVRLCLRQALQVTDPAAKPWFQR